MNRNLDQFLYERLGLAQEHATYAITDQQEFETAEKAYEAAQSVAAIVGLKGWTHIKTDIIGAFVARCQQELDSSKATGEALASLALKVRHAREFSNYIINEVESTVSAPKPIFKKPEEE